MKMCKAHQDRVYAMLNAFTNDSINWDNLGALLTEIREAEKARNKKKLEEMEGA